MNIMNSVVEKVFEVIKAWIKLWNGYNLISLRGGEEFQAGQIIKIITGENKWRISINIISIYNGLQIVATY